jgi:hypothetical protein
VQSPSSFIISTIALTSPCHPTRQQPVKCFRSCTTVPPCSSTFTNQRDKLGGYVYTIISFFFKKKRGKKERARRVCLFNPCCMHDQLGPVVLDVHAVQLYSNDPRRKVYARPYRSITIGQSTAVQGWPLTSMIEKN